MTNELIWYSYLKRCQHRVQTGDEILNKRIVDFVKGKFLLVRIAKSKSMNISENNWSVTPSFSCFITQDHFYHTQSNQRKRIVVLVNQTFTVCFPALPALPALGTLRKLYVVETTSDKDRFAWKLRPRGIDFTSDILWLVELNPSIRGFNLGITAVEHSWYIPP